MSFYSDTSIESYNPYSYLTQFRNYEKYISCPDWKMFLSPFRLSPLISDSLYKWIRFHQISFVLVNLSFIISGLTPHNYIMLKAILGILFFFYFPVAGLVLHNAYRLSLKSIQIISSTTYSQQMLPPFQEKDELEYTESFSPDFPPSSNINQLNESALGEEQTSSFLYSSTVSTLPSQSNQTSREEILKNAKQHIKTASQQLLSINRQQFPEL